MKHVLALAALVLACGEAYEGDLETRGMDMSQPGWNGSRLLGTTPQSVNAICMVGQGSGTTCSLVKGTGTAALKFYKIGYDNTFLPGEQTQLATAIDSFNSTANEQLKYSGTSEFSNFFTRNPVAESQIQMTYVDFGASPTTNLTSYVRVSWGGCTTLTESPAQSGTWKGCNTCTIALDAARLNTSNLPTGSTQAQRMKHAVRHGIGLCLGFGRNTIETPSYRNPTMSNSVFSLTNPFTQSEGCMQQNMNNQNGSTMTFGNGSNC